MAKSRHKTSTKKKIAALSLGALPLVYSAASAYIFARKVAAPTSAPLTVTPDSMGLKYQNVAFPSRVDRLTIRGWFIPGGERDTVILVHGGQSNRTGEPLPGLAADLSRRGFNVLTFDRRDCGASSRSSRAGRSHLERDVAGAFDYVRAMRGQDENIFVYGTSMGALAAVVFASEVNVRGLVLDSCFADTPQALKRVFTSKAPHLSFLVPGMVLAGRMLYGVRKFSAKDFISSVASPILFIQGKRDKVSPPEDALRLLRASANPANQAWIIDCAEHSGGYRNDPREYVDRITSFFHAQLR